MDDYEEPGTVAPLMKKDTWVRIIIMVTCSLSIIGALLIIFSFVFCKDLRSRGRQILLHISIMDLGVAAFNLIGAAVYFDKYFSPKPHDNCTTIISDMFIPSHQNSLRHHDDVDDIVMCPSSPTMQGLCLAQAVLSLFFTSGSILWTNALCFYLYFRIVHRGTKIAYYCLYLSYLLCYGIPLLISAWLMFTGRLGYSPYESSGWCSIILMHPVTKERDVYASLFGYNLWVVLTFLFVPVLSCVVHINVKMEAENTALYRRSDKFMLALRSIDYKFLLIPLTFIFLRVWSFIGDVIHLYFGVTHLSRPLSLILVVLGGIGDSGQGITNTFIFLFFTKKAKETVKRIFIVLRSSPRADLSIQESVTEDENLSEHRSLLDSTSAENISPHHFTTQSYENSTPILQ